MSVENIRTYLVENAQLRQYHSIILLKSGTIAAFYSESDSCMLEWIAGEEKTTVKIDLVEDDPFATPALFHFEGFVGIYSSKNDFVVLYSEEEKTTALKVQILNTLPKKDHGAFQRTLKNYTRAGNTNNNTIPILFVDGSLLPVYIGQLQIDAANKSASWTNLLYWGNKGSINLEADSFEKPAKPFAVLHALQKNDTLYAFGIGNDAGYLKPGMEYSDLVTLNEMGTVRDTFFTLGRLYKDKTKGGKECIFSSSGKYAILTPAFKSDDWKNKQKLFDLESGELIDPELPKELKGMRIIDHNADSFLLTDNFVNLVFAGIEKLVVI